MIIGPPGSGKSTLARMLGTTLGLPVYHMDREVFWLPDWTERDKADQRLQVERIARQKARLSTIAEVNAFVAGLTP